MCSYSMGSYSAAAFWGIVIIICGFAVLLYPIIDNAINNKQSKKDETISTENIQLFRTENEKELSFYSISSVWAVVAFLR